MTEISIDSETQIAEFTDLISETKNTIPTYDTVLSEFVITDIVKITFFYKRLWNIVS